MMLSSTNHPYSPLRPTLVWLIGLAAYFALWLGLRLEPIVANVLFFDDYIHFIDHQAAALESIACEVPAKDYRWVYGAVLCASEQLIPSFGATLFPKLLAGGFLAGLCTVLYLVFRGWGVPSVIAAIVPSIMIVHPISNEISLWNTTSIFPLWLLCSALAYYIMAVARTRAAFVGAFVLNLTVVLAYELYFIIFPVLMLSEPVIKSLTGNRYHIKRGLLMLASCAITSVSYVAQVVASRAIWAVDDAHNRSLIKIASFADYLDEKVHGVFNLLVNVYATPISYQTDIYQAFSLWKWLPFSLTVGSALAVLIWRRSAVLAAATGGFVALIHIVPTLPIFAASQSPESWRVSVPVLAAACCASLPILLVAWRNATLRAVALLCLISTVAYLGTVSRAEGELRVQENRLEADLIGRIKSHWAQNRRNSDFRVGVVSRLGKPSQRYDINAANLSVSYRARGILSALSEDFSWRGRLAASDLMTIELEQHDGSQYTRNAVEKCGVAACRLDLEEELRVRCIEQPDFVQEHSGIRLVHLSDENITAICTP